MLVSFFYRIVEGLSPRYFTKYVNLRSTSNYQTRSANNNNLKEFSCRTKSFKHSFFPFCFREWNKLDNTIRDAESVKQFKSIIKNFFSLNQRSLFSIHDLVGVKLLTRLRLQFSHLNEHKFRHNFKDCLVPCVIVVLKHKQPVTFSCVANFSQTKDKSSVMMFIGWMPQ